MTNTVPNILRKKVTKLKSLNCKGGGKQDPSQGLYPPVHSDRRKQLPPQQLHIVLYFPNQLHGLPQTNHAFYTEKKGLNCILKNFLGQKLHTRLGGPGEKIPDETSIIMLKFGLDQNKIGFCSSR